MDTDQERRRDEIGHWVLRLAFCRRWVICEAKTDRANVSPDLRARFLRSELALFRHRFETDDAEEREAFLTEFDLGWEVVHKDEKKSIVDKLRVCMPWGTKKEDFAKEKWFKVSRRESCKCKLEWH